MCSRIADLGGPGFVAAYRVALGVHHFRGLSGVVLSVGWILGVSISRLRRFGDASVFTRKLSNPDTAIFSHPSRDAVLGSLAAIPDQIDPALGSLTDADADAGLMPTPVPVPVAG